MVLGLVGYGVAWRVGLRERVFGKGLVREGWVGRFVIKNPIFLLKNEKFMTFFAKVMINSATFAKSGLTRPMRLSLQLNICLQQYSIHTLK